MKSLALSHPRMVSHRHKMEGFVWSQPRLESLALSHPRLKGWSRRQVEGSGPFHPLAAGGRLIAREDMGFVGRDRTALLRAQSTQ